MTTPQDIKDIRFSKAVGGYRPDEVDEFLNTLAEDIGLLQKQIASLNARIDSLTEEASQTANSRDSIQSVLIRAQELAEKIIADAKQKSAAILYEAEQNIKVMSEKEKELSAAFDRKATERKENLERELKTKTDTATLKAQSIEKGLADSVERQQQLFTRLKLEVSAFKADITKRYKEHIEILQKLPDEVPMDPSTVAKAMTEAFDKTPNIAEFMPFAPVAEPVEEEKPEILPEITDDDSFVVEQFIPSGFIINTDKIEED